MRATKQRRLVALNSRVNAAVQRKFEIAVSRRDITKQKSVNVPAPKDERRASHPFQPARRRDRATNKL